MPHANLKNGPLFHNALKYIIILNIIRYLYILFLLSGPHRNEYGSPEKHKKNPQINESDLAGNLL